MNIFYFRRSPIDRRGIEDMREVYSLDYFMDGGDERRKYKERRKSGERRSHWFRLSKWYSVYVGKE